MKKKAITDAPPQQQQTHNTEKDVSGEQSSSVTLSSNHPPPNTLSPPTSSTAALNNASNIPSAAPSFFSSSSSSSLGDASGITLLLSNHAKFGLFERVCYHFDLIETLKREGESGFTNNKREIATSTNPEAQTSVAPKEEPVVGSSKSKGEDCSNNNGEHVDADDDGHQRHTNYQSNGDSSFMSFSLHEPLCGVAALLECVSSIPPNKQTKRLRRTMRRRFLEFNVRANDALKVAEHLHRKGKGEKVYSQENDKNEKQNDREIQKETGGGEHDANLASTHTDDNEIGVLKKEECNNTREDNVDTPEKSKSTSPSQHHTTKLHLPSHLPLKLNPSTRVSFAYRLTSIALVIDASPSMISIYGNLDSSFDATTAHDRNNHCSYCAQNGGASCPFCSTCPLDRIQSTMRLFFKGLVQDINGVPQNVALNQWKNPILAVTVLAVYPQPITNAATDYSGKVGVLVRDYTVHDEKSALQLADAIHDWCHTDIEDTIASHISSSQHHQHCMRNAMFPPLLLPQPKSSLEDILDAADAALSTLPQEGRPIIVLATDCRSVCCGSVLDLHNDDVSRNIDVPFHVLDLSSSRSHGDCNGGQYSNDLNVSGGSRRNAVGGGAIGATMNESPFTSPYSSSIYDKPSFLTRDETKTSIYPLDQTDDSEALYDICLSKSGCFWNYELLKQSVSTFAGQVSLDSPFHSDHYFAFRRRSLRPNALQFYTIFGLSQLSPTTSGNWARAPPPKYILLRRQQHMRKVCNSTKLDPAVSGVLRGPVDQERRTILNNITSHGQLLPPLPASRTMFSTYFLSAVRVKGILLMRILEGYRAKRYGHNTQDSDKVSILFTLPLEFGTVLHYELQFVASPYHNPLVGSAHIKIELSGDPTFVQAVKNQFISHQIKSQHACLSTVDRKVADGLCKYLRFVRKEDCLESYLCPLEWGDKLSLGSPFLRRIKTLNRWHKRRHFRREQFEIVCAKRTFEDGAGLLSEFMNTDHGEEELFDCISKWSTQTITKEKYYVRQIDRTHADLTAYCILEIKQSPSAPRLFTILMDFFKGIYVEERLSVVVSLKSRLSSCRDIVVLPKNLSGFLTVPSAPNAANVRTNHRSKLMETFYHHKSWDLVQDPELLPLLTKRRWQLGNFWLLDSSRSRAVFAKFVFEEGTDSSVASASNLYLIQYLVHSEPTHVTVKTYMDAPRGVYLSRRVAAGKRRRIVKQASLFRKIYVKIQGRDKKCSRALRSRTKLLGALQEQRKDIVNIYTPADQVDDVRRLLAYSSKIQRKLRFFQAGSGAANSILADLTTSLMLSEAFEIQFAKLSIDPTTPLGDVEPGTWFLVQHDWNTLSLVHFALSEKVTKSAASADGEFADDDEPTKDEEAVKQQTPMSASEEMYTYRELTFYNVGISDLYYTKDDIAEDDSTADNPSEYLSVSELVDAIESAHGYNFSRAAYLALRQPAFEAFHQSDFHHALSFCEKQEVVNVFVSKESDAGVNTTGSNLIALIQKLVHPVPGGDMYFSFCGDENTQLVDEIIASAGHRSLDLSESFVSECESDSGDYDSAAENMQLEDYDSLSQSESTDTSCHNESGNLRLNLIKNDIPSITQPPLFVCFSLDDKRASFEDLSVLNRSANLTAYVTKFGIGQGSKDSMPNSALPKLHAYVALQLRLHLNSFVAEQTLERLRYIGPLIEEIDIRTAMKCLNEADNTVTTKVPIQFYSPKGDSMVPASSPTGSERDLEKGFASLQNEIERQNVMKMKRTRNGALLVVDSSSNDSPLPFWCFLQIKSQGFISINVHHPRGEKAAKEVAAKARDVASCTCKRVNQLFLLRNLYQTKIASRLLMSPKSIDRQPINTEQLVEPPMSESYQKDSAEIAPGFFECPVKFQTNFKLNHRCAKNKAKMTFESSLHNFAVSNRPGVFVYKDEDDHIFYMRFDYMIDSKDDDSIELLVYGVEEPGPSVTEQLTQLLRKRLISISLETLSSVLTKNPNFNLLPADILFIRSFEQVWGKLDPEEQYKPGSHEQIYEFPENIHDPVMVLMLFRQNICGSGFFHRLHEVSLDDSPHIESSGEFTTNSENSVLAGGCNGVESGIKARFEPLDFSFFYNNCQSQVNPNFQALSTLTDRGKYFSCHTGPGIALIEMRLEKDSSLVDTIVVGASPGDASDCASLGALHRLHIPSSLLQVRRISDPKSVHNGSTSCQTPYRVSVKVTNTTLTDVSVLQSWVELTLNQVVAAFLIERHLEMMYRLETTRASLLHGFKQLPDVRLGSSSAENRIYEKLLNTNKACPGSVALEKMLCISNRLPHPAVKRLELKGAVKATALTGLALELFEKVILNFAFGSRKQSCADFDGVTMVRLNKQGQESQVVSLVRNSTGNNGVRIIDIGAEPHKTIIDKPSDSPEYICILNLNEHRMGAKKRRANASFPSSGLLFRDVALDKTGKDKSDLSRSMAALKLAKPSIFSRSFAAIMFVSRSSRCFFSYNWNPQLLTTATLRFKEIEEEALLTEKYALHHQTMRCMSKAIPSESLQRKCTRKNNRALHDPKSSLNAEKFASIPRTKSINRGQDKQKEISMHASSSDSTVSPRKIRRPLTIRRPTLIGKSVEGGAVQALAASRARASARSSTSRVKTTAKNHKEKTTPPHNTAPKEASTATKNKASSTSEKSQVIAPLQMSLHMSQLDTEHSDAESLVGKVGVPELESKRTESKHSVILKVYHFLLKEFSSSVLRQRVTLNVSYSLTNKWIHEMRERDFSNITMDFILSHATLLRNFSSQLLLCKDEQVKKFLDFCAEDIASKHNGIVIYPMPISQSRQCKEVSTPNATKCPRIFVQKDINRLHSSNAVILIELTASKHLSSSKGVCHCRVWLLLGFQKTKKGPIFSHFTKHMNKQSTVQKVCGVGDSVLSNVLKGFCDDFNLQRKILHFGIRTLIDFMRPQQRSTHRISFSPLVKQIKLRFPLHRQIQVRSLEQRFMHKTIQFENSFDAVRLYQYLCLKSLSYNLAKCGDGNECLSGTMKETNANVFFFLKPHGNISFAFELCVICRSKGGYLDSYLYSDSSPYTQMVSEKILLAAETAIRDTVRSAAVNLRRDCLWEGLSLSGKYECLVTIENLYELYRMSHKISIAGSNPQISELLFDRMDELSIHWSVVLSAMKKDPLFSLSVSFDDQVYLFYFKEEDLFLLIKLKNVKAVGYAQILTREYPSGNKNLAKDCNRITCIFTNWILHWIWHSL